MPGPLPVQEWTAMYMALRCVGKPVCGGAIVKVGGVDTNNIDKWSE